MINVLITGANRGLGLGLAQAFASRPDHTVIAAIRDPSSMPEIKVGSGSRVLIITIDAGKSETALKGIQELKEKHNINTLDIVIANAAICTATYPTAEVPLDIFEDHWRVNVLGSLALFQATHPLLKEGSKFIYMSSGAGILGREPDKKDAGYGITKVSVNFLARYGHFENPDLVIFALGPGWVQTDMGNRAARAAGMEKANISVNESVGGMMKVIDASSRDKYSGSHVRYNGEVQPW